MNKKIHLFGKNNKKAGHTLLTIIVWYSIFDDCTISFGCFQHHSEHIVKQFHYHLKWLPPFFTEMRLDILKIIFSNTIPFFCIYEEQLKISVIITLGMSLHGASCRDMHMQKFEFSRKNIGVCIADGCNDGSSSGYDCSTVQDHDDKLGVINTSWAAYASINFRCKLVLVWCRCIWSLFMMRQFFMGVPKELK